MAVIKWFPQLQRRFYILIISAIVTGLIAWVRSIGSKSKATYKGVTCLLYVEIKKLYYQTKVEKYCPLYILEDAEDLYKAYTALGGNGAITSIIEEMRTMPKIKPD